MYFPKQLSKAVEKRQAEFLAGRIAANIALQSIEVCSKDYQIGICDSRAPKWPIEVTGSISHTSTISMATVCNKITSDSLGIDIENIFTKQTSEQIFAQIHDDEELRIVESKGILFNRATSLIFSAKEALFKALIFP